MAKVNLRSARAYSDTVVPNKFIDDYMPEANGEFVKVYLYLLRRVNSNDTEFSISQIADIFNHTEKDIVRALKYWERQKLLILEFDKDKSVSGICLTDVDSLDDDYAVSAGNTAVSSVAETIPATDSIIDIEAKTSSVREKAIVSGVSKAAVKEATMVSEAARKALISASPDISAEVTHEYSLDEIKKFRQDPAVTELFFIIESYLKRTLSTNDTNFVLFWYGELHFSTDLIEYLVEYCITKGHSSLRYMDKVAISWAEEGITTVESAKESAALHSQVYYGVMKALGISGRNLVDSETALIKKWSEQFSYDLEIIKEACNRTITATHQPSFEYTDSILTNWHKKGIKTLKDIANADAEYKKTKKDDSSSKVIPAKKSSKFVNFDQRQYGDSLEELLLKSSAQ